MILFEMRITVWQKTFFFPLVGSHYTSCSQRDLFRKVFASTHFGLRMCVPLKNHSLSLNQSIGPLLLIGSQYGDVSVFLINCYNYRGKKVSKRESLSSIFWVNPQISMEYLILVIEINTRANFWTVILNSKPAWTWLKHQFCSSISHLKMYKNTAKSNWCSYFILVLWFASALL